jgi:spore maturation protein CgeB
LANSDKLSNLSFLLEESRIPIYQRILSAFCVALEEAGCTVTWLRPGEHKGYNDVLRYLSSISFDYCLISNSSGVLSAYLENIDRFVFELFSSGLIFLHHDNLFSIYTDRGMIEKKLLAFLRVSSRSKHFCIEPYNVNDLKKVGIEDAYVFHHASEFIPSERPAKRYKSDVSFVGHVLPNDYEPGGGEAVRNLLLSCFKERVESLDSKVEKYADIFSNHAVKGIDYLNADILLKYWFISAIHIASQQFRGEIINGIEDCRVDIVGGDPAYMHGESARKEIDRKGLRYFPPMHDYKSAHHLYRTSKINLNITSLQFDDAVINRVIDVCASGGFVLTDRKSELNKLTSLGEEISYRNTDELNARIEYFLVHENERIEIAGQISEEIRKKCSYAGAVKTVLERLYPEAT